MTVIHTFKGWVLTDTGIISHGCLKGSIDRGTGRCQHCNEWLEEEVYQHLYKVFCFTSSPGRIFYVPRFKDIP